MRNPAALLTIDEDIRQAELLVQDRQLRLAHRATQALVLLRQQRALLRERLRGLLGPATLAAASGTALLLLARRRPASPAAATRPSARTAAFIAPLVTRLLAPSLGRDAATLLSTFVLPFAFGGRAPPRTAPLVRWPRYVGHWFELAHLGGRTDAPARDASITYLPEQSAAHASPRRLRIVARHVDAAGRVTHREGIGRVQAGRGAARLKVTFASGLARLLPWAWADYWVLDIAPDYSAALMGTPDRRHLWLLGRSPDIDGQLLERMITRAAAQGYDVERLVPVDHAPARGAARSFREPR